MHNGPHLRFEDEEREDEQPPRLPPVSNPISKRHQRKNIQKQYAAARHSDNMAEATVRTAKEAGRSLREKTARFIQAHKKGIGIAVTLVLAVSILVNAMSSCSVLAGGGTEIIAVSTYPSEDADMLGAEAAYCAKEAELQSYLDDYEDIHDYDEYRYDLDELEHDPYVLISYLSAWFGGRPWTLAEAQSVLGSLFNQQYILTENVSVETRYRTETEIRTR